MESCHVCAHRRQDRHAPYHGYSDQARIMADNRNCGARRWAVIHALEGEFVMPDVPAHDLMPIAPTVLAANHPSGMITRSDLISVNTAFLAYTRRYFFGRDLRIALVGVTAAAIQKAVMERDRKIAAGLAILAGVAISRPPPSRGSRGARPKAGSPYELAGRVAGVQPLAAAASTSALLGGDPGADEWSRLRTLRAWLAECRPDWSTCRGSGKRSPPRIRARLRTRAAGGDGPVLRHLRRITDPLFRQAGVSLDE